MSEPSNQRTVSLHDGPVDPALAGLEPPSVWRCFGDLARIPRKTGNEAGVRAYVKAFAERHNIAYEENNVGDVLLRVNPGTQGTIVGVQAHMDMVCVSRDGAPFDFDREPIRLKRDGDFVTADGTSLGADNGIGVAYALALAEETQGPLEVLLTVDEEQGFTGIEGVAPGWLRARFLINLDSEEEGYLTIASAGGRDFLVRLPAERRAPATSIAAFEVTVDGLKGGHSGVEIHRGRTNALKVMSRVLASAKAYAGVVFGINGGTAPNVIPSAARAVVGVPADRSSEFQRRVAELRTSLLTEEDPALRIELTPAQDNRPPLTAAASDRLIRLFDDIPSGVIVPSPRDPTQPFVSNNLAIVKDASDGGFELTMMSRSPATEELEKLEGRYRSIAEQNGASVSAGKVVPGWSPNYDSPLLARFQKKYGELYGKTAKILEIHAGLECGALQGKYPGMDLISVGPDITNVHSPDERVSVESTRRTFDLVRAVIRDLQSDTPAGQSA